MANTKITTNVIADNAVGITQLNVSDGSNGQFLKTDGSGTLSFATVDLSTKANLASPSFTGTVTITGASSAYNTLQLTSNSTGHGTIINLGDTSDADYGSITQFASSAGEGGRMRFIAGTTETMNLRGGKVGIGVTNPDDYNSAAENLVVGSSGDTGISIVAGTSNDSTLMFADGTGGTAGYRGRVSYDHASDYMRFDTAAAERMRIASDGKVGIGTSSPATPLHVVGANGLLLDTEGNGDGSVYFGGISGTDRSYIARSSNDVLFWNVSDGVIRFATNNAEMMRITSAGVGIGETSPAKLGLTGSSNGKVLHLGGDDCQVRLANTILHHDNSGNTITHLRNNYGATSSSAELSLESGYITFNSGTSFTERMRILSDGDVCIGKNTNDINTQGWHVIGAGTYSGTVYSGIQSASAGSTYHVRDTTNNTWEFYVTNAGLVYATHTSIQSLSDERLKENIVDLETGLDEIMALKPRRFDWKDRKEKQIAGFVAQEVEPVLPDLVGDFMHDDLDDAKSVRMGDMIPTLVKAIQELKAEIEELKSK